MTYSVLNKQDLEQELEAAGDKLVVIDFYANWCGPCKIIDPHLQELSTKYAAKAKFLKVNVDDCEDIAMTYNITSMPTFVFVKGQQIIDILIGSNVENLIKNIEKHMEDGNEGVNECKTSGPEEDHALEEDYDLEHDVDADELQDPTSMIEVIVDDQM